MIGVGINENVILTKAVLDEKGRLVLTMDYADNVGRVKQDVFDALQSAQVVDDAKGFALNIFPFKFPDGPKNEAKTVDEKVEMLTADMLKVKDQLSQLLEQYMTTAEITWLPYQGTGVDKTNYRERLQSNETLTDVFNNYAKQFITFVTPFLGNPQYKLRVKLLRQSKEKHFASIPGKFLETSPWVDSMEIPTASSKVLFTKWEKANKLDDGTPVQRADADLPDAAAATTAPATVNPFSQR